MNYVICFFIAYSNIKYLELQELVIYLLHSYKLDLFFIKSIKFVFIFFLMHTLGTL